MLAPTVAPALPSLIHPPHHCSLLSTAEGIAGDPGRRDHCPARRLDRFLRAATPGNPVEAFAIPGEQGPERWCAQSYRSFQHRVEDRGEIAGRGVDDLQNLRSRSLLFERLAGLSQEPRILDRDHRLRREILQQRDLLVGEGSYLLSIHRDEPE